MSGGGRGEGIDVSRWLIATQRGTPDRKVMKYGKEMRSVSDLLQRTNTIASKRVKPNINAKMPVWARKWRWGVKSWGRDPSCASRKGGGSLGFVATYDALFTIYESVL